MGELHLEFVSQVILFLKLISSTMVLLYHAFNCIPPLSLYFKIIRQNLTLFDMMKWNELNNKNHFSSILTLKFSSKKPSQILWSKNYLLFYNSSYLILNSASQSKAMLFTNHLK